MRKWLMLLLSAFFLGSAFSGCVHDPADDEVWPDEEQIRDNADDSHRDLRKQERKSR